MSLGFFKAVLKTEFLITALSFLAKILYGKLRLTEMQAEISIGGFSPFKYDLAKKKGDHLPSETKLFRELIKILDVCYLLNLPWQD